MTLMASVELQRQLWMSFQKTTSKIVLKGGLGAGIGAYLPKGNTVKATTVVFSNKVCSTFTAMSSRTLLTVNVREKWNPTGPDDTNATIYQQQLTQITAHDVLENVPKMKISLVQFCRKRSQSPYY